MQKKLIALAVAGLASTAAMAQSNVTLYGIADAYVSNFTSDEQRVTGVNSGGLSGSRLGFKGAEDLGNGLKAVFTLEYAIAMDQNDSVGSWTGATRARQQFVGLSGGFGTLVLGRLQTPAYDWGVKYSALGGSAFDPLGNVASNASFGITSSDRVDNAVGYVSPSFSGLTLKAAHAGNESSTSTDLNGLGTARQAVSLIAADYDNGPLSAGVVYRNVNTTEGGNEWAVGGSYDFGLAKVLATYQRAKDEATDDTHKAWSVTGLVPVTGAGAVALGYARTNMENDDDRKTWTVAYLHSLSKRTTAYAGYARADSEGAATANMGGLNTVAGEASKGLFAGVRHSF